MIPFIIGLLLGACLVFVGMSYRHNQLVDEVNVLRDELDDQGEASDEEDEPRVRFVPDINTLIHLQNARRDQQRKDIMGNRLNGQERETVRQNLRDAYEGGSSIRRIAAETGFSYGRTHKLLEESGVTFCSRGGRKGAKR